MAAPATPRQLRYLASIHASGALRRQSPSKAETAAYFNVSPPAAHQVMVRLEQRGLIGRIPGQTGSIRVLLPPAALPDPPSGRRPPQAEPAAKAAYPHLARWLADAGTVDLGMAGIPTPWRAHCKTARSCGKAGTATRVWTSCSGISTEASRGGEKSTGSRDARRSCRRAFMHPRWTGPRPRPQSPRTVVTLQAGVPAVGYTPS